MSFKEGGVLYLTACPACGDELALGWLPVAADLPHLIKRDRRRLPWRSTRADGLATDPVTCACGQVSLAPAPDAEQGRVVVTWTGLTEPKLKIVPQYGSLRDMT